MLTVSARDFGPIASATIGLKPLTIFMGRSNTGKSYMAGAINALMTAAYDDGPTLYGRVTTATARRMRSFRRTTAFRSRRQGLEDFSGVSKSFRDWAATQDPEALGSRRLTVSDLPNKVQKSLEHSTRQFLHSFGDGVLDRLRQTYGETSGFARRGKGVISPQLTITQSKPELHLNIPLSGLRESPAEFDMSQVSVPSAVYEEMPFADYLDEDDRRNLFLHSFYMLEARVVEQTLVDLPQQSFYLPAARSGIAQGHKVLAASVVRQSRRIGLEPVNIPTLPGITTEFLSHMLALDKRMRKPPRPANLQNAISFIEREVLQGRVDFDDSDILPYPQIVYEQTVQEAQETFTLDHTSSMVSELAPVILFLKYLVTPADLLILEEPESHLHPGAQRQMARGIARLVNAGVNVIITTHSDMFVAQINNLLRLSHASQRWIREHGFRTDDCLRQHQVAAYLFHYDQTLGGSVTKSMEIDSETGIDEEEFLREIELVYDEAIALQRIRIK